MVGLIDCIRVNRASPGWIDTPFNDPIYEMTGVDEVSLGDAIPLGRQGTPSEVAYAMLFLASKEASYITGLDTPRESTRRGFLVQRQTLLKQAHTN